MHARFPAIGEIRLGLHVLGKEATLMGHTHEIQHGRDHVQMRNQDSLRQILGEILVPRRNALPELRHSLAQALRVDFSQVRANLEALVDLVSFQLADGDAADELCKRILPLAQVYFGNLHKVQAYHGRAASWEEGVRFSVFLPPACRSAVD